MKTQLFDFELPADRIALRPAVPRDAARLLVVKPGESGLDDRSVCDLPDLLRAGDCLVVNDSRVIAARLVGRRIGRGSTEPLIEAGWLAHSAHVTAAGSDMPHKQELDPRILVAAGKYVPDSIDAAAASGELHHALQAGLMDVGSVYGELTAVASGRLAGRTADDELTVADLTGLGIQDAAVAALAARLAGEHGAGRDVPLGDW